MQLEGHRMGKMRPGDYIECEHRYGTNLDDPICIHQFIDEKLTVYPEPSCKNQAKLKFETEPVS